MLDLGKLYKYYFPNSVEKPAPLKQSSSFLECHSDWNSTMLCKFISLP